ncbi:MAG TPA: hypothetical protein VK176_10885 [Phycisphaerales bacterium]|nr:hypothetical protein [Phycisphaerales bacterium]
MKLQRGTWAGQFADLDFTMKTPAGFAEAPLSPCPSSAQRGDGLHIMTPLVVLKPTEPGVSLSISGRVGCGDGTVREWFTDFCAQSDIRLLSIGPAYVGGLRKNHPAILASGLVEHEGEDLVLSFVVIEDGGRVLLAKVMCTRDAEERHMHTLEKCMYSLELLRHQGPTLRLDHDGARYDIEILEAEQLPEPESEAEMFKRTREKAREAALLKAALLIEQDRFDEAATAVLSADDSGQGRAALSQLFAQALRQQVAHDGKRNPARPRALELYRRALLYRLSTYPDPHTQEEADRYSAGMDEDRAEIESILGYAPG